MFLFCVKFILLFQGMIKVESFHFGSFMMHRSAQSSNANTVRRCRSLHKVHVDENGAESTHYYYSPNVPLNREDQSERSDFSNSSNVGNEYSFFDQAVLYVRAGSGGQGASTYKKMTNTGQNGQPDGGNGGRGGNVILVVDPSLNTLAGLTSTKGAGVRPKSFRAENGEDGGRQFKTGRNGEHVTIRVPPGTIVQEQVEKEDGTLEHIDLGTIMNEEEELIVAKGGEGGEGSGVQAKSRGVRRPRVPPSGGERKILKLTLKVVADVAFVAVPNAGKSTFLAAVTRAKPKIANYPFTTVVPNLGVWIPPSDEAEHELKGAGSRGLVLCDVPGLIEGAADGVGLGHAFLRHVERCHVILHLVDSTSNDPIADYEMINREIIKYGTGQLAALPQVVVINKIDVFEGASEDYEKGLKVKWTLDELETQIKQVMPHSRLMKMSAKEREGVDDLMMKLANFVKKVKESAE